MGSDISSFDYTYDNITNNISTTTTRSSVSVNSILDYGYDDIYRVTQATNPLPSGTDENFTYDTVGNRLAKQGQVIQSVYDDANRLLENDQFLYDYDDNGNLIQKTDKITSEITQYSYDAENQLIEVSKPGMTASYRYDGSGRRIEKDVNGTVARYIYDQTDLIMEFDGSNTLIASYTFGSFVDEPLIMYRDGQSYYYHTDALGSVTDITDSTGVVVKSYAYDSFGNIEFETGSIENNFTYADREFDPQTGLYYNRARYYDSEIGRFITPDPAHNIVSIGNGNDIPYLLPILQIIPQELNDYLYTSNNPTNFIDNNGLQKAKPNVPTGKVIGCDIGKKCGSSCPYDLSSGQITTECAGLLQKEIIKFKFGSKTQNLNLGRILQVCEEKCFNIRKENREKRKQQQ